MSVAEAIWTCIYCRYLSPGECIVHDRGSEFCNEISKQLHKVFNVDIRVISAGKPQANGQVEVTVRTWKSRARALMAEHGILA